MLCIGVPAIPPPTPNCSAELSCPSRNSPPAQCDIVYVTCPDFTCPTMQPPPPVTDPPAPAAYINTHPQIPVNPSSECGWPIISFSPISTDMFSDDLQRFNQRGGINMRTV